MRVPSQADLKTAGGEGRPGPAKGRRFPANVWPARSTRNIGAGPPGNSVSTGNHRTFSGEDSANDRRSDFPDRHEGLSRGKFRSDTVATSNCVRSRMLTAAPKNTRFFSSRGKIGRTKNANGRSLRSRRKKADLHPSFCLGKAAPLNLCFGKETNNKKKQSGAGAE